MVTVLGCHAVNSLASVDSRTLISEMWSSVGRGFLDSASGFFEGEQSYPDDSFSDPRSKDPWHGHRSGGLDVLGVGLQN